MILLLIQTPCPLMRGNVELLFAYLEDEFNEAETGKENNQKIQS